MDRGQAADAAADVDPDIVGVLLGDLQTGLGKRLLCCGNGKLLIGVVTARFFAIHVPGYIKLLDLRAKMHPVPA